MNHYNIITASIALITAIIFAWFGQTGIVIVCATIILVARINDLEDIIKEKIKLTKEEKAIKEVHKIMKKKYGIDMTKEAEE